MTRWQQLLLIALTPLLLGAAPSRTKTYVTGATINAADVTENEDNIYQYLQGGLDTYAANSITTAALADAVVTAAKLATDSVVTGRIQDSAVTSAKIADGTIVTADISASATIGYSKLSAMSGDATITDGGVLAIAANAVALTTDTTGNYTASIADAGNSTITVVNGSTEGGAVTLDVVDVNCNNCIDGTDLAFGSDAQGDVAYYNGTDWARLGAGTDGQFLETNGAGANPTWSATPSAWVFVETLNASLDTSGTATVDSSALPTDSNVFMLVLDSFDTTSADTSGDVHLRFDAQATGEEILWTGVTANQALAGTIYFERTAAVGTSIPLTFAGLAATAGTVTAANGFNSNVDATVNSVGFRILTGSNFRVSVRAHLFKLSR